jgi:hypothetical protein
MTLSDVAGRLHEAFVGVYRRHVEERIGAHGYPWSPELDQSIDDGEAWLSRELEDLLALPHGRQARSPLEVFQEAMRFPTEALRGAGVKPPIRDHVTRTALPGDVYALAPASSQELTSDAWRAHLAWGTEKAQAMAPQVRKPLVALYTRNLMDRSKLEAGVRAGGYDPYVLRNREFLNRALAARVPPLGFVDLEAPEADEVIRTLADAGVRVVAYGPHVDDIAMVRSRSLGAAEAVARSRFFSHIDRYLLPLI